MPFFSNILLYVVEHEGGVNLFFQKLAQFMYGRYGTDAFTIFLLFAGIVVSIFGQIFGLLILIILSYAIYIYAIFRTFSKNISARQKELFYFNKVWTPIKKWFKIEMMIWHDRKQYKYFRCPNCRQRLRAPRGRGRIEVTCQRCRKQFVKKV
jgi:hypothetical protein